MKMLLSPLRYLPLEPAQLSLAAVLKCGQTFLWRKGRARATLVDKEAPRDDLYEWSYGHKDRTIVLRQDATGIHYRSLFPLSHAASHAEDAQNDTTLQFLRKYFVLDVSLPSLYAFWSERDPNFRKKTSNGTRFGGIRILRQPTWECLIEFICSSNNNIGRIEGMLRRLLALYGERLPCPADLDPTALVTEDDHIYAFPKPQTLTGQAVTTSLRTAGFGYRDAYVTKTAALVCEMTQEAGFSDPEAWLETVSLSTEDVARETLLTFAGVGPKVADCILLFGLGFEDVVPVDTHVYQIAIRDYGLKGSRDSSVTRAVYERVREKLQAVWGQKAGWAHQILFTADLKSFAEFADPLLALTPGAGINDVKLEQIVPEVCLPIKSEESDDIKQSEVKIEAMDEASFAATPGRRRVKREPSATKQSPGGSPLKRTNSAARQFANPYPTPPATPTPRAETKPQHLEDTPTPISRLAVRRTRSATRTQS